MQLAWAPQYVQRSDALHARVQARIGELATDTTGFAELALAIAQFQADLMPGYARLLRAYGGHLDHVDALVPVPVEAFRLARIAVHPEAFDAVRYLTSGTTSGARGLHAMRRTDTYRMAAVTWARRALLPAGAKHAAVVALLPAGTAHTSSLSAMAQMFIDEFELPDPTQSGGTRWLLRESGVDVTALQDHLRRAATLGIPLLVVATGSALVHLLDIAGPERLDTWPHTIVMPTGGFKGKSREISGPELRAAVAAKFGIRGAQVIGEYGMTELSSQLYEGSMLSRGDVAAAGVYYPPPWLSVCPIDAETLKPVALGEPGLARFIDLANVDSAVCIVTQDLIRARRGGFELLGRQAGAAARGCSLGTEEWLRAQTDA